MPLFSLSSLTTLFPNFTHFHCTEEIVKDLYKPNSELQRILSSTESSSLLAFAGSEIALGSIVGIEIVSFLITSCLVAWRYGPDPWYN